MPLPLPLPCMHREIPPHIGREEEEEEEGLLLLLHVGAWMGEGEAEPFRRDHHHHHYLIPPVLAPAARACRAARCERTPAVSERHRGTCSIIVKCEYWSID